VTGAGDLDQRVAFDKRSATSDGAGGTTTAFAEQFKRWAGYKHLRGGETVMAGRLAGKHSLVATVRKDSQTELITTDWRMRDARTGTVYNVRDITPTDDRAFLELLCESGVAA
jgi:SPP1 family predicted phage head-tail adaptor